MKSYLVSICFITIGFCININAQIQVEANIESTNLNDVYNQIGIHYLGNGKYVSTSQGKTLLQAKNGATRKMNSYLSYYKNNRLAQLKYSPTYGEGTQIKMKSGYIFKLPFSMVVYNSKFPYLSRAEAIKRAEENKSLLSTGLITKDQYQSELMLLKKCID